MISYPDKFTANGTGTNRSYAELFIFVDKFLATIPELQSDDIGDIIDKHAKRLIPLLKVEFPGIMEIRNNQYQFHLKDETISELLSSDSSELDDEQLYTFGYGALAYDMLLVVGQARVATPLFERPSTVPSKYKNPYHE